MPNSKKKNPLLSFKIEKDTYTISASDSNKLAESKKVTRYSDIPEYFKGLISHKNKKIPILETESACNQSTKLANRQLLSIFISKNSIK